MNVIGKDKTAALEVCDSAQPLPVNSGTPTMLGMAASFARSMAKFAASGFKRVDEESRAQRRGQAGTWHFVWQSAKCRPDPDVKQED